MNKKKIEKIRVGKVDEKKLKIRVLNLDLDISEKIQEIWVEKEEIQILGRKLKIDFNQNENEVKEIIAEFSADKGLEIKADGTGYIETFWIKSVNSKNPISRAYLPGSKINAAAISSLSNLAVLSDSNSNTLYLLDVSSGYIINHCSLQIFQNPLKSNESINQELGLGISEKSEISENQNPQIIEKNVENVSPNVGFRFLKFNENSEFIIAASENVVAIFSLTLHLETFSVLEENYSDITILSVEDINSINCNGFITGHENGKVVRWLYNVNNQRLMAEELYKIDGSIEALNCFASNSALIIIGKSPNSGTSKKMISKMIVSSGGKKLIKAKFIKECGVCGNGEISQKNPNVCISCGMPICRNCMFPKTGLCLACQSSFENYGIIEN